MKIRLRFFSRLRDLAGVSEAEVEVSDGATVQEILNRLYSEKPALREFDRSLLIGSGVEFVPRQHPLKPDEEIALMPPVQGG